MNQLDAFPANSPEALRLRWQGLKQSLEKLQALVGSDVAMAADPAMAPSGVVNPQQLDQENKRIEQESWLKKTIVEFEEIVERNVQANYLETQQVLRDRPWDLSTLAQISLRSTMWKYEELFVKDFINSIDRYVQYIELHNDRAEGIRQAMPVQRAELATQLSMDQVSAIMPKLQAVTRLVWALEIVSADTTQSFLTTQQRTDLDQMVTTLRQTLPASRDSLPPLFADMPLDQQSTLHELRLSRDQLSGHMREVFQQTIGVQVQPKDAVQSMSPPQALYTNALVSHRELVVDEYRETDRPTVDQYREFLAVQLDINRNSLSFHADTLKHNADAQSLLAMRDRFGPMPDRQPTSNPQRAADLAAFYETFLFPSDLDTPLREQELARYQTGLTAYMSVVTDDLDRYGQLAKNLDDTLVSNNRNEAIAIRLKHGLADLAYWVPEHSLGYARFVGLDYAALVGEQEELQNHREVKEFIRQDHDVEAVRDILAQRLPGLRTIRAAVEADMGTLTALQTEHPPEECVPGQPHNGVSYTEIRQQYITAIESMQNHHQQWLDEIAALYDDITNNLSYHMNRLGQNRLLDEHHAPNWLIGGGISAAELFLLSELGRSGGVRNIPYLGWGLRPFRNLPFYRYNLPLRAWHFAGRVANAPTRPVVGLYNLTARWRGWAEIPLIDESPHAEMRRLRRQSRRMQRNAARQTEQIADIQGQLSELTDGVDEAAAASAREGSASHRAYERINRFRASPRNAQLLQQIADNEEVIRGLQQELTEHLQQTAGATDDGARALETGIRRRLRDALDLDQTLRMQALRRMIGRRLRFWPHQVRGLMDVHNIPLPEDGPGRAAALTAKREGLKAILRNADDVNVAMRSGLMGSVGDALNRPELVQASRLTPAASRAGQVFNRGALTLDDLLVGGSHAETAGARALSQAERELVGRWWDSPAFQRMLFFGGVALQGYVLRNDLMALEKAEQFHENAQRRIKNDLDGLVQQGVMTRNSDGYHYDDLFTVTLHDFRSDIAVTANNWRTAVDSISLGTLLLTGAIKRLALPLPLALAVMGVEITTHIAISRWQKKQSYAFVRDMPPWLVAWVGGTMGVLNTDEYHLLQDTFVDLFLAEKDPELRQRLFFSWFMQELGRSRPDLLTEIIGVRSPDELQEFYEGDFQTYVLDVFKQDVFVNGKRADVPKSQIDQLDTEPGINPLAGLLPGNVLREDILQSLVAAAQSYVSKQREDLYIAAVAEMKQAEPGMASDMLRSRVYELGSKHVYGRRLLDDHDAIMANGGVSREQLLRQRFGNTLNTLSNGGSWLDIANNKRSQFYQFIATPLEVREVLSGEYAAEPVLSHNRNFSVSTKGIAGLPAQGDYIWFNDRARTHTLQPLIPEATTAIPRVEQRVIDQAYPYIAETAAELAEQRSYMVSWQHKLEGNARYLQARLALENTNQLRDAAADELHQFDHEDEDDEADLERNLVQAELALEKAEQHLSAVQREYFGYNEELFALYQEQPTEDLRDQHREELAQYLQELALTEQKTRLFTDYYAALRHQTETVVHRALRNEQAADYLRPKTNLELADALYGSGANRPLVLSSNDVTVQRDAQVFADMLQYPRLMADSLYLNADHLFAVHLHTQPRTQSQRDYVVTFAYSKDPDTVQPTAEDMYYVQLAGTREGDSHSIALGLPEYLQATDLPPGTENVFFASAMAQLDHEQQGNAADIVANMNTAERMYRAGTTPGELTQIDRGLWGVRILDRYYVIRRDPATGALQSKVHQLSGQKKLSTQEAAQRWVQTFAGQRATGNKNFERTLTKQEKEFAHALSTQLDQQEWGTVPTGLVRRFHLQGSPDEYRAQALPAGVLDGVREHPLHRQNLQFAAAFTDVPLQKQTLRQLDHHLTLLFEHLQDLPPSEHQQARKLLLAELHKRLQKQPNVPHVELRHLVGEATRAVDAKQQIPASLYEVHSLLPPT